MNEEEVNDDSKFSSLPENAGNNQDLIDEQNINTYNYNTVPEYQDTQKIYEKDRNKETQIYHEVKEKASEAKEYIGEKYHDYKEDKEDKNFVKHGVPLKDIKEFRELEDKYLKTKDKEDKKEYKEKKHELDLKMDIDKEKEKRMIQKSQLGGQSKSSSPRSSPSQPIRGINRKMFNYTPKTDKPFARISKPNVGFNTFKGLDMSSYKPNNQSIMALEFYKQKRELNNTPKNRLNSDIVINGMLMDTMKYKHILNGSNAIPQNKLSQQPRRSVKYNISNNLESMLAKPFKQSRSKNKPMRQMKIKLPSFNMNAILGKKKKGRR